MKHTYCEEYNETYNPSQEDEDARREDLIAEAFKGAHEVIIAHCIATVTNAFPADFNPGDKAAFEREVALTFVDAVSDALMEVRKYSGFDHLVDVEV